MVKAVLIDDERHALIGLEYMLKKFEMIEIVGMYTNPIRACEEIGNIKPDVVFLDIEMPQLKGIDAASCILEAHQDADIIFVTAYNQYAIEAFELNALDYLLKPTSEDRLKKSISRLLSRKTGFLMEPREVLQIRFFGGFYMSWIGKEPIKWRAEKTKELFLYLLQNRNRSISKDEILDQLWPDYDLDRATKQLYNGIYYIKKNLQEYGVSREYIRIDSNYHLKLEKVQFDVEILEDFRSQQEKFGLNNLEKLQACIRGEYLQGEYYTWIDLEQARYAKIQENVVIKVASEYIDEKMPKIAEELLLECFRRNPLNEEIVRQLLVMYKNMEHIADAQIIYKRHQESIRKDLGIEPSEDIRRIIEA